MNIAIIGAGLIGKKRAEALPKKVKLSFVCDVSQERAEALATEFKCESATDWKEVVARPDIDAVFIATTHNWLAPIAIGAIKNGKHVFMEKPGGHNAKDLKDIIKAQKKSPVVAMLGYNHRLHPSMQKAKQLVDSGKYGPVLFIRAKYGHGGRLGYEKEWRFIKEVSGGGELVDQGPHLIDLVNMFIGKMDDVKAFSPTLFWDTKLEDTSFFIMKNKKNQYAYLSVSCVEWKNLFQFEIMLKSAKIQIDGLGRSYGQEKLTLYTMKPEMGPPTVKVTEYPEYDTSWKDENAIFFKRIADKDTSPQALEDGLYVWQTIEKIYGQ
jgi:predicted dehydrogenase